MLHARPKILIADDSATNRLLLRRALFEVAADVVETCSGQEALDAAQRESFALILLDVQMPELDGFEVIRRLRRLPHACDTPVILISAEFTDSSHARLGYDLGAADYLINKPVDPVMLRQKIKVFLDLHERHQELQRAMERVTGENQRLESENEQFRSVSRELHYQATHDSLTGLPNRVLLEDRLLAAIMRGRRNGKLLALAYIDLDHLKAINDRHGHEAGDQLLVAVGQRLVHGLRGTDTVARLGGDEFVVLMEGLDSEDPLPRLGDKLLDLLRAPLTLGTPGGEVRIAASASIGIAAFPDHAEDAGALLARADRAMYQAKQRGGARFVLCSEEGDPPDSHP